MRILDPILTAALESGNYQPFFRFEHRATKGAAPYITTDNVLNFSIGSTEFAITLYNVTTETTENNAENEFGRIIRGCVINGVEYSVATSDFFITEYKRDDNYRYITGAIVPKLAVNFLASGTYAEVITEYCALFGLTPVFKEPADAWLDYQFLPDGKSLNLNKADAFFPLLKQKYLITATDNGDNELLFSHAFSGMANPEYTITNSRFKINLFNKSRRYVSRDEAASINYTGDADAPLHNLGFLHSTASNPAVTVTNGDQECPILPVHLKYQTGDYIQMRTEQAALLLLQDLSSFFMINDSTYFAIGSLGKLFKIEVTEELDTKKFKELPWRVTLKSLPIFTNTEGGALPSTIERIASYTPLVTKNFDKNLDATVNNLQALAEAVDEMTALLITTSPPTVYVAGKTLALNTATSKFYAWSGSAWIQIN